MVEIKKGGIAELNLTEASGREQLEKGYELGGLESRLIWLDTIRCWRGSRAGARRLESIEEDGLEGVLSCCTLHRAVSIMTFGNVV